MRLLAATLLLIAAPSLAEEPKLVDLTQSAPRDPGNIRFPFLHRIGPVIPGLQQDAVPQGLAYSQKQEWLLISSYFDDGRPSVICVIDASTGRIAKCLTILEQNGKAHTGHVGGIAVSERYLWIASGQVYRVSLDALVQAAALDYITLDKYSFRAECGAATLGFRNGILWVGEFVEEGKKGSPHHLVDRTGADKYAWICGYKLSDDEEIIANGENTQTETITPDLILSVREKLQGLAFANDRVMLSCSFSRSNKSNILSFRIPPIGGNARPDTVVKTSAGDPVPVWFLDARNRISIDDYPPMTEGICLVNRNLAVICESGAAKYQKGGKGPLDVVIYH